MTTRFLSYNQYNIEIVKEHSELERRFRLSPVNKLCVEQKAGDLFEAPIQSAFAHCVSQDLRMGMGIAMEFRKRFGGIETIKRLGKVVGECAAFDFEGRKIFNMITKFAFNQKPFYSDLESCLIAVRQACADAGIVELAMPKIGCGLDRLDWTFVVRLVHDTFVDSGIKVTVYLQ